MTVTSGADDGRSGAAAKLAAMLREAMTSRNMRQSDLVRVSELSAGTVSNVLNATRTPTLDTLNLLLHALGLPPDQVRELRALRDRANSRDSRLDLYLAAAQRAAHEHPYPGVMPGVMPPLTTVYVKQDTVPLQINSRREVEAAGAIAPSVPRVAEEALPANDSYVVLAGPGGGKSSLLRALLAANVGRWLAGKAGTSVPVLVPASALLAGPLTQAVASAATAELMHFGLTEALSPATFASPPRPGCSWLLFLDGLDEVTDSAARTKILQTISAVRSGPTSELYRFVLATRPLPNNELDLLGDDFRRFELLPLTPNDTRRLATGWFHALAVEHPEHAADAFARALERTKLVQLARIPLMASMLCQLHAAAPSRPLPASRGRIYDEFIGLLHRRQHSVRARGTADDLSGLEIYGARFEGEQLLKDLPQLISWIAADLHHGAATSANDALEHISASSRPVRVPVDAWRSFLRSCLRRSGILADRTGQLIFLHQTLLEYFAAKHSARTAISAKRTLRRTFRHYWLRGTGVTPAGSRAWFSPRIWRPPTEDSSYVGFLLEATGNLASGATTRRIARLARRDAGLPGYEFIAEQVRLGTRLPAVVVGSAAARCGAIATNRNAPAWQRVSAATLLARQFDPQGPALLDALSRDVAISGWAWIRASEVLIAIGDPRGAERLYVVATDSTSDERLRVSAAQFLAWTGDRRGLGLLESFAADSAFVDRVRVNAAGILVRFGDRAGIELMHTLAEDPSLDSYATVLVADWLATFGEPAGIEKLRAMATDRTVASSVRFDAADRLHFFTEAESIDVLDDLARDRRLRRWLRKRAATLAANS